MNAVKIYEENKLATGRILLAENDDTAAIMLYMYFFNRGYEIERVADTADVISALLNKDAGVIILDAEFCGTKTYNLLRVIKKLGSGVKVIFTSNKSSIELVAEAREEEIFFHATKPFDFEELNMAISQAVKYNGGE